jgi:DNA-binding XRE family transcriptional regulator
LQPGTRFLCKVVRKALGLTQKEMAEFLGVSKKTIESYEQRWRKTPVNVERLALLYLGCFKLAEKKGKIECWKMTNCPKDRREECVVWKTKRGDLCWMFGATMCGGRKQDDWRAKFECCTQCKVLRAVFE